MASMAALAARTISLRFPSVNKLPFFSRHWPTQHSGGALGCYRFFSAPSNPENMPIKRPILSLDPQRIPVSGQEVFDLSGRKELAFYIPSEGTTTVPISYQTHGPNRVQFPPGTIGTPYYKLPPAGQTLLAGELRFRVVADAAEFEKGEDLKLRRGGVWRVPLYNIALSARWEAVRAKLVRESLVEKEVFDDLRKHTLVANKIPNFHYEFDQPFVLDLSQPVISRVFLKRSLAFKFLWVSLYASTDREGKQYRIPARELYKGRLLVRFDFTEPLTTPAFKQKLGLRVLEILEPMQSLHEVDVMIPPVVGEFLQRRSYNTYVGPVVYPLARRQNGELIARFAGLPWPGPSST